MYVQLKPGDGKQVLSDAGQNTGTVPFVPSRGPFKVTPNGSNMIPKSIRDRRVRILIIVIQYSNSPYFLTFRKLNANGRKMNIPIHTASGIFCVSGQKLIISRIATASFGTTITQLRH